MDTNFDGLELLGYVNDVYPGFVQVHMKSYQTKGQQFAKASKIGDYLLMVGDEVDYLGKILEITTISNKGEYTASSGHVKISAKVEVLLGKSHDDGSVPKKGLMCTPGIGDRVFYITNKVISEYLMNFGVKYNEGFDHIELGQTTDYTAIPIHVSLQSLLGRHCAIVGTTGSGKSWTVAKVIEEMKLKHNTKMILIDPTGEYLNIQDKSFMSVNIATDAFFHYSNMTVEDLYYLIKPSDNIQMPKLLEAIRSLKAFKLDKNDELFMYKKGGTLRKANMKKSGYEHFYYKYIDQIEDGRLDLDIKYLSAQIIHECIFDTDKNHPDKFGNRNEESVSRCLNLITRTSNLLHTDVFKRAFGFDEKPGASNEVTQILEDFLRSDKKVLRIGFEGVGFEFQAREIIANAIGKYLLMKARSKAFKQNPVVIFVDEAHQFMNKTVVDEYFKGASLTAFDQIAKECRKHGLFLCIATQIPRDIPVGTLSQMGTFIVHRLINHNDQEVVATACSSATDQVLDFLPVLGEGEAILSGADFPMDIAIKVKEPILKPDSSTPIITKFDNAILKEAYSSL